ncbi:MAG: hypothetical protein HC796_08145 [Synechococcaceae cyanobacterium RL_1_2]|nr:hypothetical protein [Synechococcaceae cyanobacterium RL_1_2]
MSIEPEADWQKKLENIEQQINQTWSEQSPQVAGEVKGWFAQLPTAGKAAIVVGGTFCGHFYS